MKQLIFFLIIIIYSCSPKTAKKVYFKNSYGKNKKYEMVVETVAASNLEFQVDSSMAESLGSILKPMETKAHTIITTRTETGNKKGEEFPVITEYISMKTKNEVNGAPQAFIEHKISGTKLYGKSTEEGAITIDSVVGKIDDFTKETLKNSFESLSNNSVFPDKAMIVGDTFKQVLPMTIPIPPPAGGQINMQITTIFKLIDIKANLAYFDLQQYVALDSSIEGTNVEVGGQGHGNLVYDLKEKISKVSNSELDMNLMMRMNMMELVSKSKTKTTIEIKVLN